MAQWAKCLPHKNESLGLNPLPPSTNEKILHSSAGLHNPNTRERERQEDLWACCLASVALSVSFRFSERLKMKMERN